jgi:hypothetical protein
MSLKPEVFQREIALTVIVWHNHRAVPAGEGRSRAKVLVAGDALSTDTTSSGQPRNGSVLPDPPTRDAGPDRFNHTRDLVAGDDGQSATSKVTLNDLEVCAADCARRNLDQQLVGRRMRVDNVPQRQRSLRGATGLIQDLCPHAGFYGQLQVARCQWQVRTSHGRPLLFSA